MILFEINFQNDQKMEKSNSASNELENHKITLNSEVDSSQAIENIQNTAFQCGICNKYFKGKSELTYHAASVHVGNIG